MTISQQEKALLAQISLSKQIGIVGHKKNHPRLEFVSKPRHSPLRQEDGSSTLAATTIMAGTLDKNQIRMVKSKRGEGERQTIPCSIVAVPLEMNSFHAVSTNAPKKQYCRSTFW